jgi:hypothetical protein
VVFDDRVTVTPRPGAGPLRITVPTELFPPYTDFGAIVINASQAGLTESVAVTDWLPALPVSVTVSAANTSFVQMSNVADVCPDGMTTDAGTDATPLELDSVTVIPSAGAGPLNVTVP